MHILIFSFTRISVYMVPKKIVKTAKRKPGILNVDRKRIKMLFDIFRPTVSPSPTYFDDLLNKFKICSYTFTGIVQLF